MNKFCIPTSSTLRKKLDIIFNTINIEEMIQSIKDNLWSFLFALVFVFIVSNIYSFLLRLFTKVIVFICIAGFYIALAFIGYYSFKMHREYKTASENV